MSQYIHPSDAHKGREMTARRVFGPITCTVKGTLAGLDVSPGLHVPPVSLGNFDRITGPLASVKVQTLDPLALNRSGRSSFFGEWPRVPLGKGLREYVLYILIVALQVLKKTQSPHQLMGSGPEN